MEIHELPSGSPTSSDYLAIDNGTTRKTGFSSFELGDNNVTFTSGDTTTPTVWQTVSAVTSGSLKTILAGISSMMANVRYLKNLIGGTDISSVGATITSAISTLGVTIGTFTSSHTISSMTHLSKYGRMVFVDLVITTTSAVSPYDVLATIPVGYRPIAQCFGLTSAGGRFDATYSGSIRAVDSVASGTTLYITMNYISQT